MALDRFHAELADVLPEMIELRHHIHRHPELVLAVECEVETHPPMVPPAALDISIPMHS